MKRDDILENLENLSEKLGYELKYDDLKKGVVNTMGGSYLLKGQKHITIHRKLTLEEKIDTLAEVISLDDFSNEELLPEISKILKRAKDSVEIRRKNFEASAVDVKSEEASA